MRRFFLMSAATIAPWKYFQFWYKLRIFVGLYYPRKHGDKLQKIYTKTNLANQLKLRLDKIRL